MFWFPYLWFYPVLLCYHSLCTSLGSNKHRQVSWWQSKFLLSLFYTLCFLVDQELPAFATSTETSLHQVYRGWLHKGTKSLKAVQPTLYLEQIQKLASEVVAIEVAIGDKTVRITVEGKEIKNVMPSKNGTALSGVTVVVLHPSTGEVMLTSYFMTEEPRGSDGLVRTLNSLQAGRILILVGFHNWMFQIPEETSSFLKDYLGGFWVEDMCYGENWISVSTVDGPLWAEVATVLTTNTSSSTPLHLVASVPKRFTEKRCEWYGNPKHLKREEFCERYEGYEELCHCETFEINTQSTEQLLMQEQIPVVIVTAKSAFKAYRQIKQLWSQAGGSNTSILLSIDGLQPEARDFAEVMGLQAVYHVHTATVGTIGRISEHVKFSIWQGFKIFQNASKIIIVEDDLRLAPDFISYFHQTAPLLDLDKSILSINAFNYNSFFPTAIDTTKLYRGNCMPAYGWMITKELSLELLPLWPSKYVIADWDVYLHNKLQNGRSIIAPEVPRAFHDGTGGLHVSGWEQITHYDPRPLNMDPHACVNISYLIQDDYESFLWQELNSSTVLTLDQHPCKKEYIPKEKVGSFIIYYGGETEEEQDTSFYTLIICFNGYEQRHTDNHRLMHTIGYYGNSLYVISCPDSPYCNIEGSSHEKYIYTSTLDDYEVMLKYKHRYVEAYTSLDRRMRYKPLDLEEEVTMQNYVYVPFH